MVVVLNGPKRFVGEGGFTINSGRVIYESRVMLPFAFIHDFRIYYLGDRVNCDNCSFYNYLSLNQTQHSFSSRSSL